jgi:hypothetical protein
MTEALCRTVCGGLAIFIACRLSRTTGGGGRLMVDASDLVRTVSGEEVARPGTRSLSRRP